MHRGKTPIRNTELGEVNPLSQNMLDATTGTACSKKEIREAISVLKTVCFQWFPEQSNLEDEIFLRGVGL